MKAKGAGKNKFKDGKAIIRDQNVKRRKREIELSRGEKNDGVT